ncbi:MAG: molybdenum cofactor biosynthesis protein MoeB, partial [Candidatus Hydrogenedentes bacterium]|nr:molybdenum cofactor biosynthesis protein MoeB [Candidatus Hydrogenedentota bacterium]
GDSEISPVEVKAMLDQGKAFKLIDVREPHEWEICKIDGAELIPLGTLEEHLGELDEDEEIVVHCKMGGRSAKAQDILLANGFSHVLNMQGGILRWSDDVDPSVAKY